MPKILFRILRYHQRNSIDFKTTVPSVKKVPLHVQNTSINRTKTTWKSTQLGRLLLKGFFLKILSAVYNGK